MMSEKSKQHRNQWYRDHVNKYCICVNKDEVEVVDYIEDLLKDPEIERRAVEYFKNSDFEACITGSYFLDRFENQDLDIFSDSQSSRARYKRLYNQATLWVALMIVYFILLQPSFENISSWYLAPTIWEYSGLQLVGMIVMQTFFVLIQLLPMLIFMSGAVIYALIGTKAKKLATM